MKIEEAIERACAAGYKGDEHFLLNLPEYAKSQIWLDPSFWQSLGKALGWNTYAVCMHDGMVNCHKDNHWGGYEGQYLYHWHRFIDHLAEGGTAETYFETLK